MATKKRAEPEIEMRPDAWERFEAAVDAGVKSGPKHREKPKPRRRPTKKAKVP